MLAMHFKTHLLSDTNLEYTQSKYRVEISPRMEESRNNAMQIKYTKSIPRRYSYIRAVLPGYWSSSSSLIFSASKTAKRTLKRKAVFADAEFDVTNEVTV